MKENIVRFVEDKSTKNTPNLGKSGWRILEDNTCFYDMDFLSVDECQLAAYEHMNVISYWNDLTPSERTTQRKNYNLVDEKYPDLYSSAADYAYCNR